MTPQQLNAMKLALEALEKALHYHGVMLLSDPPQDAWKYHRVEQTAHEAITAIKETLAEHAMREVQRLGQEIEQEPVAWLLPDKNINSIQVDSIQRLISRLKYAHHTDLRVRINGQDEWFEADWLKHMARVAPPQRTEQNPMPDEMLQAITDPENQPSQYGTVTLDYHFEKIKKWEDLFERISNKVLQQPEQEPVAHCKVRPLRGDESFPEVKIDWVNQPVPGPLYAAPPQRTWVGLTDKDWNRSKHNYDFQKGVDWAEPILKQKNGYAEE